MAVNQKDVVRWLADATPGSCLDVALQQAGFTRLRSASAYDRRLPDLCQRLKLVIDIGPLYEPDAIAHVLPQVVLESAALGAIVQRMVPHWPLYDPATANLVLRVQLQNLSPKGSERDRASKWFIYAASDLPALLNDIGQFTIDHALPFLDCYRDVTALTLAYEGGDERFGLDRRLCLYVAAAFLHIGQAEKALRLMEARFSRPALRKQYASSFEFIRNWRPA